MYKEDYVHEILTRLTEKKQEEPTRCNNVKMISLLQGFSQALTCVVIHQGMDTEARILQNTLFTEPFICFSLAPFL